MNQLKRTLKHLLAGRWQVRRRFPAVSMQAIEDAIQRSETSHMGELRFAVEAGLDWHELWHGISPRQRAIEAFSQLRLWDTEHNSGVLIYLLLADRRVEIIADRGIHARVGDDGWGSICREMEAAFRAGNFEQGVLTGIARISTLLAEHFPAMASNSNELSNKPVTL
ncbi:MAG: TPM domain-containing protein [Methylophilales bacterium]|nr:TPM domain-containing protein [Methylophilales bacterium]